VAFSNPEGKKQFKQWLDDAFPPKGEAEDQARAAGTIERAREEDAEEESEEEAHEDENYNEDIAGRTSAANSILKLGNQSFLPYSLGAKMTCCCLATPQNFKKIGSNF
jgi:hypothetical protein